jgi:hypothetical protein
VDRYSHHIDGFEIWQRILKRLVHTVGEMSRGISRRGARRRRCRQPHRQFSSLSVETPVLASNLVFHGKVAGHCAHTKLFKTTKDIRIIFAAFYMLDK